RSPRRAHMRPPGNQGCIGFSSLDERVSLAQDPAPLLGLGSRRHGPAFRLAIPKVSRHIFPGRAPILQVPFNRQAADHVPCIVELPVEQVLSLVTVQRRAAEARAARHCCSRLRARARRDMTVPSGTSVMAAISVYDTPSSARSTTISRNATGKASSA